MLSKKVIPEFIGLITILNLTKSITKKVFLNKTGQKTDAFVLSIIFSRRNFCLKKNYFMSRKIPTSKAGFARICLPSRAPAILADTPTLSVILYTTSGEIEKYSTLFPNIP